MFLSSSGAIALELPAQSLERSDHNPINTGVEFTPPPDSRRPSSSVGGASRGSQCVTGATLGMATPLVAAVVPADTVVPLAGESPQDAVGHGLTTLAHPVLWVYVASDALPEQTATLSLRSVASSAPMYTASVQLHQQTSLVGIALPEDAPSLQVDQSYVWELAIACPDPAALTAANLNTTGSGWQVIRGTITRVAASPLSPSATALQQAAAYAQTGIWYDALAKVAEVHTPPAAASARTDANTPDASAQASWRSLLAIAGLTDADTLPIQWASVSSLED